MLLTSTMLVSTVQGAQVTWVGQAGQNGHWSDPANWSTGRVPTNDDDVVIGSESIDLDGLTVSPKSITALNAILHNGTIRMAPDGWHAQGGLIVSAAVDFMREGSLHVDGQLALEAAAAVGGNIVKTGSGDLFVGQEFHGSIFVSEGKLTVDRDAAVAGRVEISEGTQMMLGGSIGSLAGKGEVVTLDDAKIGIDGSNSRFEGNITGYVSFASGRGSVEKVGAGTMTFAGLASQPFKVSGGAFLLDGASIEETLTLAGGTFGGDGTVHTLVANEGIVAPGVGIGTLYSGDVTFEENAIYAVDLNADQASDKIDASGLATLNGGAVKVTAARGRYAPATTYTILTAAGGIDGTFDTVSVNFAYLDPTLTYDATNAYLTLTRNGVEFSSVANSANQAAVGEALDSVPPNSDLTAAIVGMSADEARNGLDQLSGEAHAAASSAFLAGSAGQRNLSQGRMEQAFSAINDSVGASSYAPVQDQSVQPVGAGLWGQAYGGMISLDAGAGLADLNASSGGLALGADGLLGDWRIGIMATYGLTNVHVGSRSSSLESIDYGLGVYGGREWNQTTLTFGASHTRHAVSSTRNPNLGGIVETLSGKYGSATTQVYGELSQGFAVGHATLSPFANVAVVHQVNEAFSESGGVAALNVGSVSQAAGFTTIGLRGESSIALEGAALLLLRGEARRAGSTLFRTRRRSPIHSRPVETASRSKASTPMPTHFWSLRAWGSICRAALISTSITPAPCLKAAGLMV